MSDASDMLRGLEGLPNLGPDAPVTKNESGGLQSEVSYRFDLIDPKAIFRLAQVLDYGAKKYTPDNWRKITPREHLNHALIHAFAYLAGDAQDDHLGHFFTRAMMALAMHEEAEPPAQKTPEPTKPPCNCQLCRTF